MKQSTIQSVLHIIKREITNNEAVISQQTQYIRNIYPLLSPEVKTEFMGDVFNDYNEVRDARRYLKQRNKHLAQVCKELKLEAGRKTKPRAKKKTTKEEWEQIKASKA